MIILKRLCGLYFYNWNPKVESIKKKKQKKIDLTKNTFKVLSWQDNQSFRMKKKNVLHEKGKV